MKILVLLLALAGLHAQAFTPKKVVTFSDKTELMNAGRPMRTLPAATSLKLLQETQRKTTKMGIEAPLFEVETKIDKKKATGLVWGGDLPIASLDLPGKDVLMVAPVQFELVSDTPRWTGEARVFKGKQVLARLSFDMLSSSLAPSPSYIYDARLKVLKDRPFGAHTVALGLRQNYSACDFPAGDSIFIWDGKKLILGPNVQVANSADYAVEMSYKYLWKPNCLQVQYTRVPKKGEEGKVEVTDHFHAWDGTKFTKAEKCPN